MVGVDDHDPDRTAMSPPREHPGSESFEDEGRTDRLRSLLLRPEPEAGGPGADGSATEEAAPGPSATSDDAAGGGTSTDARPGEVSATDVLELFEPPTEVLPEKFD